MSLSSWLRALLLLRKPEVLEALGNEAARIRQLDRVRASCPGAVIRDDVLIQGWEESRLLLGAGVKIEKGNVIALGDARNGFGVLEIGEGTWVGQYNNIRLTGGVRISIGKSCLISQFCTLVGANHSMARDLSIRKSPPDPDRSGITIGDDVWLGAGVVVLPSVAIHDGAVIAANSVVNRSIPEYEIWAGVPARKVGERV